MSDIDLTPDFETKFSPDDRAKLRAIISDPLYLKLLRVVNKMKPSPNCAGAGSGQRDAFSNERANARLGEIRGWELHQVAILAVINEKLDQPKPATDEFTSAGALDLEPTDEPMPGSPSPSSAKRLTRKTRK